MLDPIGRQQVLRTVHSLNREKGITVVQITHYMEEAAMAGRVVVMSAGRVVMDGTPREVFTRADELHALHLDVPQPAELCRLLDGGGGRVRGGAVPPADREGGARPCLTLSV